MGMVDEYIMWKRYPTINDSFTPSGTKTGGIWQHQVFNMYPWDGDIPELA